MDRTVELLRRLGSPHQAGFRIVHIGGTNGKGSTAAMVAAGLKAAGKRVGLYTSPALERWNQRIQVDGRPITDAEVAERVAQAQPAVAAMVAEGWESPTEFEVSTALAFLHFARQRVDWVVLEVGLGGRYDATNVVERPAAVCITNVELDHTQVLGRTHRAIAWDKAGILKPGVPALTAATHPEALAVLQEEAARVGAPLQRVAVPAAPRDRDWQGQTADLPGVSGPQSRPHLPRLPDPPGLLALPSAHHRPDPSPLRNVRVRMLGRHQLANAACAAGLLQILGVPETAIRQGLAEAVWPGRFELWPTNGSRQPAAPAPSGEAGEAPPLILDTAHNPAGAQALAQAIQEYLPGRPLVLVLGLLADRDPAQVLAPLLPLVLKLYATTPLHPSRALPAATLAEVAARLGSVAEAISDPLAALAAARAAAPPEGAVVVAGSHYLVGPVRTHLASAGRNPEQAS